VRARTEDQVTAAIIETATVDMVYVAVSVEAIKDFSMRKH
jgi:hypothetical protein